MSVDATDCKLLERVQGGFPLVCRPFAELGAEFGLSEREVIERLARLKGAGLIRRIGPVLDPEKVGLCGTLAATAAPEERLEAIAAEVSACPAVTHNYKREPLHGSCPFNLWFTLTAPSQAALEATIAGLERALGLPIATFPAIRKFKIGVRFSLSDDEPNG